MKDPRSCSHRLKTEQACMISELPQSKMVAKRSKTSVNLPQIDISKVMFGNNVLMKYNDLRLASFEEKTILKKTFTIQPNLDQQRLLITKNLAKKFVTTTIKHAIEPFIERAKAGSGVSRKRGRRARVESEVSRPVTAPASLVRSLEDFLQDLETEKKRPQTVGGTATRQRFYTMLQDTITLNKSRSGSSDFSNDLAKQLFEESKDAYRVFNSFNQSMKGVCHHSVQAEQSLLVKVDFSLLDSSASKSSPGAVSSSLPISSAANTTTGLSGLTPPASAPSSPKQSIKKSSSGKGLPSMQRMPSFTSLNSLNKNGMAIILDPATNTFGQSVILSITYEIEQAAPKTALESVQASKKKAKKQVKTVEYTIRGSGNDKGLSLFNSSSNPWEEELVNGYSESASKIYSSNPVMLPGWQGKAPIFVPSAVCKIKMIMRDGNNARNNILSLPSRVRFSFLEPVTTSTTSPRSSSSPRLNIFPSMGHASIKLNFSAFPCTSSKNSLVQIGNFFKYAWKSKIANLTIPGGMPALNVAAMHGNMIALHHLISNGANVDRANRIQKNTALHEAIYGGHALVVDYLLKKGANQALTNYSGKTALHVACANGNTDIVNLLLNAPGARVALSKFDSCNRRPVDYSRTKYVFEKVERAMRTHRIIGTVKKIGSLE